MRDKTDKRMSLRGIEVFVAAVEEGSVTGAARRLGASASTVSQHLSSLEAALGTRLVERNARRFVLTAAGEVFRPRAQALLDDLANARAELAGARNAPHMRMRIGLIEDLDATVLPDWLARMAPQLENCQFIVTSAPSHANHQALVARLADVIVSVDTLEPADWLEEHLVLRDPFVLIHPKHWDPIQGTETLSTRPMVRYAREQAMGRQIEAHLRRSGLTGARHLELSNNSAVFACVAAGHGWALTTALALAGTPDLRDRIAVAPAPQAGFSRTVALYARRETLGALPAYLARTLRESIAAQAAPWLSRHLPWLGDGFRVLGGPGGGPAESRAG